MPITSLASSVALSERIRKTLANTFVCVAGMWALTALASYGTLDWQLGVGAYLSLFALSLAVLFGVHAYRTSAVGLGLLALFSVLEGASLGPLMRHYLNMPGGGQLVATAAGLTGLATLACAAYCISSRRSFARWGGLLFAGLIVLVVASIAGLIFNVPALHLTISALASILFTAYLLYDIGEVVSGVETNYISASLGVYLNTVNLLVHLLRILGCLGSDD